MIPVDSMKSFRNKSMCKNQCTYDTKQDSSDNTLNMEEKPNIGLQEELKQHLYVSNKNKMKLSNSTPMHYWIRDLEIEAHKKALTGEGRMPHSPIMRKTCTQNLCDNVRNNEKCGCAYFFNMGRSHM